MGGFEAADDATVMVLRVPTVARGPAMAPWPEVEVSFSPMIRVIRVLLVALLLGLQAEPLLRSFEVSCAEQGDCCTPTDVCRANCATCACCARPTVSPGASATLEPEPPQAGLLRGQDASIELQLLPHDILHVPRSA